MALRASVVIAAQPDMPGSDALVLIDGSDTAVTAGGLAGYTPTPGDRLLVERVGYQVEVIQFLTRGTPPDTGGLTFPLQIGEITIDEAGGITVPNPTGTPTQLPADGSEAVFAGSVRTGDLTVNGGLTVNGAENDINGTLRLTNTFRDPTLGPTFRQSTGLFANGAIPNQGILSADAWSMSRDTGSNAWVSTHWGTGSIRRHSALGGYTTWTFSGYTCRGALYAEGFYWAIAQKSADKDWYLLKISTAGSLLGSVRVFVDTNIASGAIPAVGTDNSGQIMCAAALTGSQVTIKRYTTALAVFGSSIVVNHTTNRGVALAGVGYAKIGPAGEARIWVLWNYYIARNGTNGYGGGTVDREIKSTNCRGLHIDDPLGSGQLYAYLLNYDYWVADKTPINYFTGITSACYTWYDNDGTTHESARSPILTTSTMEVDWRYVVLSADPPPDDGTAEAPNSVRFYLKRGSGSWYLEATDTANPFSQTIVAGQGSVVTPPTVSTFPDASAQPGYFASEAVHDYGDGEGPVERFRVDGGGNGRWDQIVVGPGGTALGVVQVTGRTEDDLTFQKVIGNSGSGALTVAHATWTSVPGSMFPDLDPASTTGADDDSPKGIYLFTASIVFEGGGEGRRLLRLLLNGAEVEATTAVVPTTSSSEDVTLRLTWMGMFEPGVDDFDLQVWQSQSPNASLDVPATSRNKQALIRLTGRT